jgi:hypothetical protein
MQVPNWKWKKLSKLQENKIIQSTYIWIFIVPIFAKILAKIESYVEFKVFDHSFVLDLNLPFQWQIFYFSSLFFAIANFICYLNSPEIVKNFDNFNDFTAQGKGQTYLESYTSGIEIKNEKQIKTINRICSPGKMNWEAGRNDMFQVMSEEDLRDLFSVFFDAADESKERLRFVCTVSYWLGFILIGFVFLQNFITVIKLMIS